MTEYPPDIQLALEMLDRVKPQAAQILRNYLTVRLNKPNGQLIDDLRLAASTIRNYAGVGIRTSRKQDQLDLADRLSLYACEIQSDS